MRSWILFGFWSDERRGARTYLSRTRNPQSFAHSVIGPGHDLQECFAGTECGELVGRDSPGTVAVNKARILERDGRAAEECAPTLLVLSGALAESQSHGGVLGDLLGQVRFDACEVGEALGRQDAHHAGLSRPREQWDDVPAFASER